MRFGILGPLEARRSDGTSIAAGGPRLRALLAMLLLDAGRVVTGERLVDGLYGEQPGAVNALQSQVSRLRKGMGADAPVEFHPAGYRLAVEPDEVDALVFERLAAEGRAETDPRARAEIYGRALALWRGPALADVRDAPFAEPQATRLEQLRLDVVEERVEADLALGRHRELVGELRELVAADPVRERLRGQLMRALHGSGRQSEALAAFESARAMLADELGVDPSPELAAIHLAMLRGELQAPTSADQEPAAVLTGVPAQLTSFVGRDDELRALTGLLDSSRLVTLIGPGGAGKTRLAVETASARPDEVAFVELGGLDDGVQVPQAVLAALGLREGLLQDSRPADPVARLVAALSGRSLLLVLDNCEHLVEAAAALAHRLLGSCPRLRVLATSREALGITGERLFPVTPLTLPEDGRPPLTGAAVRLFAERAAAVRPGFAVGPGNAADVLRICRALDGLPLAIELAAARLRALPVPEVAARLDDAFALLSRGSRTAEPRHRTLRAIVEWSWDLLDPDEQRLARRLSVFSGGATLAAVERVCGVPDAVDVLSGLADKSLIEVAGDRYRMLRTIHAFCAERLAEAGEAESLRRAHAEHVLDLLRAAAPHLLRAEQLGWLAGLDAEHGNLLAAVRWAAESDPALGLRLLADLSTYWWLRGRRAEGVAPARALLAALGTRPPAGLEGEYVLCVLCAGPTGPELRPHLESAGALMRAMNLVDTRSQLVFFWSIFVGPFDEELREAITTRVRDSRDPWIGGLGHLGQGVLAQLMHGDMAAAEREFLLTIECFRALGERWGMMTGLSELGDLTAWLGDGARFTSLMGEALRLAGELGALEDRAELLCRRADGLRMLGDPAAARAGYEEALELAGTAGAVEAAGRARFGLAELARRDGEHAEARARFEAELAGRRDGECAFGEDLTYVQAQVALGWIAAALGEAAEAAERQREALTRALALGSRPHLAMAAEGLAGVADLAGDHERAALLLGAGRAQRGLTLAGDRDVAEVAARARAALGDERYERAYARGATLTGDDLRALAGERHRHETRASPSGVRL
ncbi:AfsR/SARP family transcriptional regulator [Nonomuraea sp. NN258]|uniref:BTAD domain-containing putative transcriptional regulator n=1 Tax=Nonomuraea antri TaxID=2730852 RepID=UPI001568F5AC|nr:BTAD domain-containing putative transcriptional regulator [Nonomuraea antri]NRQ37595.1 AfsR/SARP family transcriptional regulator [Nonomuraea antri]